MVLRLPFTFRAYIGEVPLKCSEELRRGPAAWTPGPFSGPAGILPRDDSWVPLDFREDLRRDFVWAPHHGPLDLFSATCQIYPGTIPRYPWTFGGPSGEESMVPHNRPLDLLVQTPMITQEWFLGTPGLSVAYLQGYVFVPLNTTLHKIFGGPEDYEG